MDFGPEVLAKIVSWICNLDAFIQYDKDIYKRKNTWSFSKIQFAKIFIHPGVTEQSLKGQSDLIRNYQERINVLESEKKELMELNEQLQAEVNSLRRLASFRDDGEFKYCKILFNGPCVF